MASFNAPAPAPSISLQSQKKKVPGYTGYIPKQSQVIMTKPTQAVGGGLGAIPGYQGYIPSAQSENLYGQTTGHMKTLIKDGKINKGIRISPGDRFTTVAMQSYKDPGIVKMPVPEIPKEVQKSLAKAGPAKVPKDTEYKFWGIEKEGEREV